MDEKRREQQRATRAPMNGKDHGEVQEVKTMEKDNGRLRAGGAPGETYHRGAIFSYSLPSGIFSVSSLFSISVISLVSSCRLLLSVVCRHMFLYP